MFKTITSLTKTDYIAQTVSHYSLFTNSREEAITIFQALNDCLDTGKNPEDRCFDYFINDSDIAKPSDEVELLKEIDGNKYGLTLKRMMDI